MFEKYDLDRQTYYETFISAWQQSHSLVEVENRLKAKYEVYEDDTPQWRRKRWVENIGPSHHIGHTYPDPDDRRCKKHYSVIEHTRLFLTNEGIRLKEIPVRNDINWEVLHVLAQKTLDLC